MKRIVLNFAATGLTLGILAGGVAFVAPAAAFQTNPQAASLFEQAGRAVAENRLADAIDLLEQVVGLAPRDAGYRMLLADSYMKSGRFGSAETTYGDVLALDPGRPRAGLSRALMQVATGRPQEAIAQLDGIESNAPPADVGLAYALAGAPLRAVELLEAAARTPAATPRIRQNLALAYAFGGDWARARTIAAQDLAPADVSERMTQWAAIAHRAGAPEPVAALLGVVPAQDPGQPIRIALSRPQPVIGTQDVRMAAAAPNEPVAAEAPVSLAPVSLAQVNPEVEAVPMPTDANPTPAATPAVAFAEAEPAAVIAPEPAPAPVPVPVAAPAETEAYAELEAPEWGVDSDGQVELPAAEPAQEREPVRVRYAAAAETMIRPDPVMMPVASRAARAVAPVASRAFRTAPLPGTRSADGRFVVQLGAFASAANAERAWRHYEDDFGLRAEQPVTMTFDHRGRLLHRVAISGFARRGEASQICQIIKTRGGACFVRSTAGDAAIDWAARYGEPA